MATSNTITFDGKAGGYFLVFLVTMIFSWIPFLGTAFVLNYSFGWMVNNLTINGKQLRYNATYGEALKFIFINTLLVMITLGIYIFWYAPKAYRFVASHSDFISAPTNPVASTTQRPIAPVVKADAIPVKPVNNTKPPASKTLVQ